MLLSCGAVWGNVSNAIITVENTTVTSSSAGGCCVTCVSRGPFSCAPL
jgi:hypothetical protein